MASLDVFAGDGFTMTELISVIDKVPFVPGAVGRLGIFEETPVTTTNIEIEERTGTLYLVPNTPRSGVALQNTRDQRKVRIFKNMHLPIRDEIMADEIQNKRAFGSQTELQVAQDEVAQRLKKMAKALDATVEFGRISALQGTILDADGTTVIYNLFTEFGVAQTSFDFLLGTGTTDILSLCENVRAAIQDELGADGSEEIEVMAFVGKAFFQRLVTHPTVRTAYQYYQTVEQKMNPLQQDLRYMGFKYGGITFKVYRGAVNGVNFVPTSQGTAFPTDVPDLYETFFSPAPYMETANTQGRPRYVKMVPDPSGYNKFWQIEAQTNPLSIPKRPGVLIRLTTSN
jgi:hypothetical protein